MSTIPGMKEILIEVLVSVLDLLGISAKYIKMKRIGELDELFRWSARKSDCNYFCVISKFPIHISIITRETLKTKLTF